MLSEGINNQKILRGCIYNRSGEYCEVYIENTITNVAAFVARAYSVSKVQLIDALDCLVLSTMGNFLDTIFNEEYRVELLEELIPMQTGEIDVPEIKVAELDYEECYGTSKEEYIAWVTETTGYDFI